MQLLAEGKIPWSNYCNGVFCCLLQTDLVHLAVTKSFLLPVVHMPLPVVECNCFNLHKGHVYTYIVYTLNI